MVFALIWLAMFLLWNIALGSFALRVLAHGGDEDITLVALFVLGFGDIAMFYALVQLY